jgi:hypothetical protein
MSDPIPSRAEMEAAMRDLLASADLPEPDEILPHDGGGIVCLWHSQRIAIVVDPDDAVVPEPESSHPR